MGRLVRVLHFCLLVWYCMRGDLPTAAMAWSDPWRVRVDMSAGGVPTLLSRTRCAEVTADRKHTL